MKLFLDLDGVLVDFYGASQRTVNKYINYEGQQINIKEHLGHRFFDKVLKHGWEWWRDLDAYYGAREFYDECLDLFKGEVWFLTSASIHGQIAHGKMKWLKEFTGINNLKNVIITGEKYLLANKHSILVDDTEKQIDKFVAHGGHGILFARQWNRRHKEWEQHQNNIYEFVLNEIKLKKSSH